MLVLALLLAGCANRQNSQPGGPSPLRDSRQLVLVVSDEWDATTASLQCYARAATDQPWRPVGDIIPVNLGRMGMAWGRGLHGRPPLDRLGTAQEPLEGGPELVEGPPMPGPVKREGDGKAPAGVFELPLAFGYAPKEQAKDVKLPYLQLTAEVVGVDDPKSKHYNQLVRTDQVSQDWDSAETMRRDDGLYEWGVLVNHNVAPAAAGAGSCIFLHIWRGPDKPTAGCTAMAREDIVRLVNWLEPAGRPILVQLPRAAYDSLAAPWRLPRR